MIRLFYTPLKKDGKTSLCLCFKENETRKYKSLTKYLTGEFSERNWNTKTKQFFKSSYSETNNQVINKVKKQYSDILESTPNISLEELYKYFDKKRPNIEQASSIFDFIDTVINEEKKKPTGGCNFKCYEKLQKRLREFESYLKETTAKGMTFNDLDEVFCEAFKDWIIDERKGKDYKGIKKLFTSFLNRADKNKSVDFDKSKINKFQFPDCISDTNECICELPVILQKEQMEGFANLDLTTVQGKYSIEKVQLFYDTCMLMLGTFMRPCDVVLFNERNIQANVHGQNVISYVPKKKMSLSSRSKQKVARVPLEEAVETIIMRYRGQSEEGFILPIYSEIKAKAYKDGKEGLLKKFNKDLNIWLKKVAKVMKLNIELNAYVFRHTSISHALNIGHIPIATVAKWAGTSVSMIEQYYNNSDISDVKPAVISSICATNNDLLQAV